MAEILRGCVKIICIFVGEKVVAAYERIHCEARGIVADSLACENFRDKHPARNI